PVDEQAADDAGLASAELEEVAEEVANGPEQDSGEDEIDAAAPPEPAGGRLIRRDRRAEREAYTLLASLGLRQLNSTNPEILLLAARAMPRAVAELTGRGWMVSADQQVL